MHVLFIPSWYPINANDVNGSFFREQAIALASVGVKVGVISGSLLSLRKPLTSLSANKKIQFLIDDGVYTYRKNLINWFPRVTWLIAHRFEVLIRRLFIHYVQEHGLPDVIHVHAAIPVAGAVLKISEEYGLRYVYSEHSSAYARNLVDSVGAEFTQKLALRASASFAVSKPFATLLEKKLKLADGKIGVFPNPVHSMFFEVPIDVPQDKCYRFLHVSLLDENKNVHLLINAFEMAFKNKPNFVLRIIGEGSTRSKLEIQVSKLGIEKQVQFLGLLSREFVRNEMAESDVFVLPSRYETFGVVVVEALAMGLVVVATRCGGPEDIIDEDDGYLVEVDDAHGFACAMQEAAIIAKDVERKKSRRERCRSRFSTDVIIKKWIKIYKNIIHL